MGIEFILSPVHSYKKMIKNQNSLSKKDLYQYLLSGVKAQSDLKVGLEYEMFGLSRTNYQALPFKGSPGIEETLNLISDLSSWKKCYEKENLTELHNQNRSIFLEPGGQVEFSTTPWKTVHELKNEIEEYTALLLKASEKSPLIWIPCGVHPTSSLDSISWMPKGRYEILSQYLGEKGDLSHRMMKQTASLQVNFDFTSESDAIETFRLLMGLSSLITALYANSPFCEGKSVPYQSYRAKIWQATDPDRCGLIKEVFDPHYSLEEYLDWVLSIPTIFIQKEEKWIPLHGKPFKDFLAKEEKEHPVTIKDFALHLSSIFTEVRLKQFIEIRSADSHLPDMALSLVAFLTGLLYQEDSKRAAWDLIRDWSWDERIQLYQEVPKYGLRTRLKKGTIITLVDELLKISTLGLKKRSKEKKIVIETDYLKPLEAIVKTNKTKADEGIELFKKSSQQWIEQNQLKKG